jgi:purine nucleosidase
MKNIIYDCDPGVDDALAIILALKSKKIKFDAITSVYGNSSVEQTTLNVLRILNYFNDEINYKISVAKGASRPLVYPKMNFNIAKSVHGIDGLGDTNLFSKNIKISCDTDAVSLILQKIKEGTRILVATGALTNIAKAFQKDSKTMHLLKEIVIMGGAIKEPGNIDRLSEANFYSDPHAADYVLKQKVKIIIIPLDATHKAIFTPKMSKSIPNSKTGKLIKKITKKYQEFYMKVSKFKGNPLHDPLARAYVINPNFVKLVPMNLCVEMQGKYTRGTCVPELRSKRINKTKSNVCVAMDVKSKEFLDYFIKTISS